MNTGFPRALSSCSWHPIPGLPAENHLNVLRVFQILETKILFLLELKTLVTLGVTLF